MMKSFRFVAHAILFLVPFVPLVIEPYWLFPFVTGKALAFRFLVLALSTATVALLFFRQIQIKPSPQLTALGVLLLTMMVADVTAPSYLLAIWGNYERMGGFIELAYLAAYTVILTALVGENWRIYLSLLASASLAVSALAIFLHSTTFIRFPQADMWTVLDNPSYLGEYAMMGLFLCLYLAKDWKWWLLGAAVEIPTIYLSGSRGALIGVCAGLAFYAYLNAGSLARKVSITAILGLIAFAALDQSNQLWVRTAAIANDPRVNLWQWALHGFSERPWFGWGHEGFRYVFIQFGHIMSYQPFDRAHNLILDWLVQGGVVGCAAYLSLIGVTAWGLRREPALLALIAAYLVNTMFVFDTLTTYITLFSIVAFSACLKQERRSEDRRPVVPRRTWQRAF